MGKRRTDGRLRASVTVGVKPDGTPIRKFVYGNSQREIDRKVEELKLTLRTGDFADPGRMSVSDLLELWLKRHIAKKEPKTQEFSRHMVNYITAAIGAVKVKDLGPLHIENLLDEYRDELTGTTLHHIYGTMRAAINKAIRWRLMPNNNPCKGVDPPTRTTRRNKPLEHAEIQRLLAAAHDDHFYCLYLMAIWTGMREGELLGLLWSDIDFDKGWLQVQRSLEGSKDGEPIFGDPKTEQSEREIPLSPVLTKALKEHRRRQIELRLQAGAKWKELGLVFTSRIGGPVNPSNLRSRYWYPLLERAGLRKVKFHDLRHTAATLMLTDLGYDIKTVQELLGHTEARTTLDIYGHGRDSKKQEAVRRLDAYLTASHA